MKEFSFEKDTNYTIYYEVSEGKIHVVKGVRIKGITSIEGKQFLEITGSSLGSRQKEGYLIFNTIKAILPSGYIKPKPQGSTFETQDDF
jgi:hypothetical protein